MSTVITLLRRLSSWCSNLYSLALITLASRAELVQQVPGRGPAGLHGNGVAPISTWESRAPPLSSVRLQRLKSTLRPAAVMNIVFGQAQALHGPSVISRATRAPNI